MSSATNPALAVALAITASIAAAQPRVVNVAHDPAAGEPADWAPLINAALAAAAPGDTVRLPPRDEPYAIRQPILIDRDAVTLDGTDATVRLADDASQGRIVDCVEVRGTPKDPVDDVTVRGLTIDANYWAQPGSYNPRGLDSDHARRLTVEGVTILNAFVGLTFGLGVHDAVARDCTVRHWFDDAFNASGDEISGGCSDIAFIDCTAEQSLDEARGGRPGARDDAWEIEDGATRVTLTRCTVQDCGGNGFTVRNHPTANPVTTSAVTLRDCVARRVDGWALAVFGQQHPCTVEDISLIDCRVEGVTYLYKDVRGLAIDRSVFSGLTTLGPVRDGTVRGSTFTHVRVWSTRAGTSGDEHGYDTAITFDRCRIANAPWIYGDAAQITFNDCAVGEP